jgi:hypothetical protein
LKADHTANVEYLLRLLSLNGLEDLSRFLTEPDDPLALNCMETPDDFYLEVLKAEDDQERVESLELLYALPIPSKVGV